MRTESCPATPGPEPPKPARGEPEEATAAAERLLRFTGPAERRLFLLGCSLFVLEALGLDLLSAVLPGLAAKVAAVVLSTSVGGRALAITTGLAVGLDAGSIILTLSLFNVMWILIFYAVTVSAYANLVASPFLQRIVRPTTRLAERQRDNLKGWPALGLLFFIWLPFPWTGAAVGSMIGFLLGMPSGRVMCVVLPAMLFSVVTWTLGFEYLFLFEGTAGKVVAVILLLAILLSALWGRARNRARGPGRPGG